MADLPSVPLVVVFFVCVVVFFAVVVIILMLSSTEPRMRGIAFYKRRLYQYLICNLPIGVANLLKFAGYCNLKCCSLTFKMDDQHGVLINNDLPVDEPQARF